MAEDRALEPAEIARLEAESRKFEAEARKAAAEAETAELSAEVNRTIRDGAIRAHKAALASDSHHHIYRFSTGVGETSVKACMSKLAEWMRQDPRPQRIEIVFSSPGGSIIDGFVLFDYIQQVRRSGIHVTTSTLGYAASMAGVLLQAGDDRVMGKESWLLIHEASFGASGSLADVTDTVDWVKRMQDRLVDIYAERSGKSKTWIKKKFERKDWWLNSTEALTHGFIDRIE